VEVESPEFGVVKFHSMAEAARFHDLLLFKRSGAIKELVLQPPFEFKFCITPADPSGIMHRETVKYIADFMYYDVEKDLYVVEDVKGTLTSVYKKKRKWFLKLYPELHFREVMENEHIDYPPRTNSSK